MTHLADMAANTDGHYVQEITLAGEGATSRLGEELAARIACGDLLLVSGELGAGKSSLARALIRAAAGDPALDVPSPTFTLVQHYETDRLTIHHFDLYRISGPDELEELGLNEALDAGIAIVEWPDRASHLLAHDRLEISLSLDPASPELRLARLRGHGAWAARLARMDAIRRFLDAYGYSEWQRSHLQGDASARRYEKLRQGSNRAILMDSPPAPDPGTGPLPYSRIAHLAEDVVPFVAIGRALKAQGLSAPQIYAADLNAGLLVLEDFGCDGLLDNDGRPVGERYATALDVLVQLHAADLPPEIEAAPGRRHRLPHYDMSAFLAECELLLGWFVPHVLGNRLSPDTEDHFREIWRTLLAPRIVSSAGSWVLRDYHSPNLLWLAGREGTARVGLLDFQDTVIGPRAYDVASLIMDARVDIPARLQAELASYYIASRQLDDPTFNAEAFSAEFALMAAQRNTKILGIFARLARRDGKPHYLAHLPRISDHLEHAIAHPALAPLKAWYDTYLPAKLRISQGEATQRR